MEESSVLLRNRTIRDKLLDYLDVHNRMIENQKLLIACYHELLAYSLVEEEDDDEDTDSDIASDEEDTDAGSDDEDTESSEYETWPEDQEDAVVRLSGLSEQTIAGFLGTRESVGLMRNGDEICVVCYDGLTQEEEKVAVLDCGHEYHSECIKAWLVMKNFCPVCKAQVVPGAAID